MLRILLFVSISFFISWSAVIANTHKVPDDYFTIQEAINAAVDGDTVLVSEGTYQENINFRGKNIVVSSYYGITGDVSYINNTIIDGSNPVYPDTASCVLIISGEDSTAVLQGFTLTGGKGTKWPDEHDAGTFVEGGGIFVTLSSPTINNNLIVNNEAINSPAGTVSAGGGAIRCGDGSPRIINNIILNNKGMYGGGIVLNYCSNSLIANNIINGNRVYEATSNRQTFGGGGLWIYASIPGNDTPNIIENNTIIGNSSNSVGGGIRIWYADANVRNNIVWNNFQSDNQQIHLTGSNTIIEYNDVEYGFEGIGNISLPPSFADSSFYLNFDSPCIDAGNPEIQYNDPEDPNSSGNALWPAMGTIRNDIGAYGGPLSLLYPDFSSVILYFCLQEYDFGFTLPNKPIMQSIPVFNNGSGILSIDSMSVQVNKTEIEVQNNFPFTILPASKYNFVLTWTTSVNKILNDTLLIYHNDPDFVSPYKLALTGSSFPTAFLLFDATKVDYGDIDVNIPQIDETFYVYNDGSVADSVYITIMYERVKPDSAIVINPAALSIDAHDSVGIQFTLYPPLIKQTAFNQFQPKLIVDSRFSVGTTHFLKTISFHLTGNTDVKDEIGLPAKFSLSQNFPNPFNPITRIKYSIAGPVNGTGTQFVILKIYNVLGKEIATLVNEEKQAGSYKIEFDAGNLSSGIYFYSLNAGTFKETKKMILLR
jgi:hypothetical protein